MHIVGGVQEYSARANWKLLAENSTDILHVEDSAPDLPRSRRDQFRQRDEARQDGRAGDRSGQRALGRRAARDLRQTDRPMDIAWGEEARRRSRRSTDDGRAPTAQERADRMAKCARNMLIFPNLVLNDIMSITVRVFQPIAPDHMDISVWSLAPLEEVGKPALSRRLANFLEFLGPGGFATPDDIEALESCQRAAAAAREAPWNDLVERISTPTATMSSAIPRMNCRSVHSGAAGRRVLLQAEKSTDELAQRSELARRSRSFSSTRRRSLDEWRLHRVAPALRARMPLFRAEHGRRSLCVAGVGRCSDCGRRAPSDRASETSGQEDRARRVSPFRHAADDQQRAASRNWTAMRSRWQRLHHLSEQPGRHRHVFGRHEYLLVRAERLRS